MKPLAGILRSKRFYLFGLIVLLPAVFLSVVAVRTFQSELIRHLYQVQERQEQISRLFENDLNNWLESLYRSVPGEGITRFQIRNGTLLFPHSNILASSGSRNSVPVADMRVGALRRAETLEREGHSPEASVAYQKLLRENRQTASLARLSLLRLALTNNQREDAASWLEQIRNHDHDAFTETGVPVWIGSALLLIRGSKLAPETTEFLEQTLIELEDGAWNLEATQWAHYGRTISTALREADPERKVDSATSDRIDEIIETANSLDSIGAHVPEILALQLAFEGGNLVPVGKIYFSDLDSIVALRMIDGQSEGFFIDKGRLLEEGAKRLNSLTTAEDFQGNLVLSDSGIPAFATALPSFPGLGIVYSLEGAAGRALDFQGNRFSYLMTLLSLVIVAALFFIYRAFTHQIELTRMKTDFVSAVSHEFRSPLSAIQALLERVESGKASKPEMLIQYHQVIRQEVHRLTQMVNELLDFARLEEGKREFVKETFGLNEIAREVVTSFENLGYQKRLVADFDDGPDPPVVRADPTAVSQCLQNLVDNALKFSPAGSPVKVKTAQNREIALVEVVDQGPGIPASERSKIFEPFYRGRGGAVQQVKGVGFGLSLVKRLMQEQGGQITLQTEVDRGSTFRLAFPVKRSGEL